MCPGKFKYEINRPDHFDLNQIASSGQAFRIEDTGNDTFVINAYDKSLTCLLTQNKLYLSCDKSEWDELWIDYFDLNRDYNIIEKSIYDFKDEHLIKSFEFGKGIRILKQHPWETIITFLISQNNNITRIKRSVNALCRYTDPSGICFPKAADIPGDVFMTHDFGLGYRNRYLAEMFEYTSKNPAWIEELKEMDYDSSMKRLTSFTGIGNKVANCICLFGLGHTEAFPIDTHVKKLMNKYYPEGFDTEYFGNFAGIIQQYLFYYELKG
ncbi:MAG: 8-oxoguanine DNA glycosylase [Lachnospiraceae bacterium]|nr:8-oxoguanine DNA glycosylase [Lachnospiraceae bacterium]